MPTVPRICLTLGEPAGIGPEVTVRALARLLPGGRCRPVVVGDAGLFRDTVRALGLGLKTWTARDWTTEPAVDRVLLLDQPLRAPVTPGLLAETNSIQSVAWVHEAARACLEGRADALVTAPIDKRALPLAGRREAGHTELLASLCGADRPLMMLAAEDLRVALVTTHLALAEVPAALTEERVLRTLRITARGLIQDLGLDAPRLGLAALNPHAGEDGRFGHEESLILTPAVERGRAEGLNIEGPLPADTIFAAGVRERFDAIVCCYHDQGLAPLKALSFDTTVNITLNLPIVRTSPGHGAGYALAAHRGSASARAMIRAIRLAIEIADRRHR